jgi:spermidine synthase
LQRKAPLLFLTVFVIATSGLVYELVAGALASYVLGDSVVQFSTTIGVYLFAMGIGSYLSKFVGDGIASRFVEIEIAAALIGGFSAPALFVAFAYSDVFRPVLYGIIVVVGTLVGLEIPLLMRILRDHLDFKELVAKVLSVDYLGALFGSLLFALVLVPSLGLARTSLVFGIASALVALTTTFVLAELLTRGARIRLRVQACAVVAALVLGFVYTEDLTRFTEQAFYSDPIVYARDTPYQRIVITRSRTSTQLFLNGNLQFSSSDEYRYHEALVHPGAALAASRRRVLVLGGGDGLALRELYRYPDVEEVVLVDLDEGVTRISRELDALARLNGHSLDDPRTTVLNEDAMVWLADAPEEPFDLVIADFPDPNNFSLGKLYTRHFYTLVSRVMDADSVLVVQSTSPYYARRSFWCIERTISESGFWTAPYHVTVPSFGLWGFVVAKKRPFDPPRSLAVSRLRFLNDANLPALFVFDEDIGPVPVETNRLDTQRLVDYYEEETAAWQ